MKNAPIILKAGVAGFHRGELFKADADGNPIPGTGREAWPWQKNLVLDTGLDRMGDNSNYAADGCQVGSGNATPLNTDTALQVLVASTTSRVGNPVRSSNASPPYSLHRVVFQFGTGAAAGVLAELGFTMSGSSDLFSRSLIKDGGGSPTTITVLSDEVLQVTYELRWYAPTVDATGTIQVSGNDHDYIVRACTVTSQVGSGGTGGYQTGWGSGTSLGYTRFGMDTVRGVGAFSGDIGTITGNPANSITSKAGGASAFAYDTMSFQRDYRISFALGEANHVSGVRSLRYAVGPTCWQLQLDPPVMKTADDTFTFDVRILWGRA